MNLKRLIQCVGLCAAATLAEEASAAVTNVFLRAGITTQTMPDGRQVAMWGFARESTASSTNGVISVPGPAIKLGPGTWDLVVTVRNTLPEPISIVIPNQTGRMGDPVRNADGRVRSFTHETAPGATGTYSFTNVNSGTYLYHSGTHPAVQVQMGLYGEMTKLAATNLAYASGPDHVTEATFLLSEVDPDLHDAVASGQYGPGLALSSTLESRPQYFFINGRSYTPGLETNYSEHVRLPASFANGGRALFRFINAGINFHTPVFSGLHLDYRAEDGRPYAYPKQQHAVMMAPLKTMDAYWIDNAPQGRLGLFPLFDRNLGLANGPGGRGGMITYVDVGNPGNNPPDLQAIPDQITSASYPFSLQTVAADFDQPAQTLTYQLSQSASTDARISNSGLFTWTAGASHINKTYPFTITVTDSGTPRLSTSRTFNITVREANVPPILSPIANQVVNELTPLDLALQATDANLPAQSLQFSLANAPAGASLSPAGRLQWTPTELQGGSTYSFTVNVVDDGIPPLSDSKTFTVTVNEVNSAPTIASIGNQSAFVGVPLTFTATATDSDIPTNSLTFSLGSGAPAGSSITSGGAFAWTPNGSQVGTNTFNVVVTDNGIPNLTATQTVTAVVGYFTQSITNTGAISITDNGSANPYPRALTVSGSLGIVQSVKITLYQLRHQRPSDLDILLVSPSGRSVLLMSDCGGSTALNSVNNPTLTFSSSATTALTTATLTTGTYRPTDLSGAPDTFVFPAPTSGWTNTLSALTNTIADGTWNLYIRDNASGPSPFSSANNTVFGGVSLELQTVPNSIPVLSPITDKVINEGALLSFSLSATDANQSGGQTLSYSLASGSPAGANVNSSSGLFTWTPTEAQGPGVYSLTAIVRDSFTGTGSQSAGVATQVFTVTVNEVNAAPVLAALANRPGYVGQSLTFTATATDSDIPTNRLTFSLDALAPSGATITTNGLFSWTPTAAQIGTNLIKVIVTDNGSPSLSATQSFNTVVGYFTQTVSNTASISIPSGGTTASTGNAGTYPLSLTISGSLGKVQDVTVTLNQVRHPRPSDLDILLVSPSGKAVMLMSDCGGTTALTSANNPTLTFSSSAASALGTGLLSTGTYLPTDLAGQVDTFLTPAPAVPVGGWSHDLATLAGSTANGTWSIYIRDNVSGPGTTTGSINGGISLTVKSVP